MKRGSDAMDGPPPSYSEGKGDTPSGAGTDDGDSQRAGLIAVNNLTYVLEPDLSVAVNATYKKHFFQDKSYTVTSGGQLGRCTVQSGADYIDTQRSFLVFTVTPQHTGGASAASWNFGLPAPTTYVDKSDMGYHALAEIAITTNNTLTITKEAGADLPVGAFRPRDVFVAANGEESIIDSITTDTTATQVYVLAGAATDITKGVHDFAKKVEGSGTVSGGTGMNLIKQITINSRSGDELCRIRKLNQLKAIQCLYTKDDTWWRTVGRAMGHTTENVTGAMQVTIPMSLLSDLFAYGRLLPAGLMAGMQIDIEWEDPKIAFQSSDPLLTQYKIDNPIYSMKSVQLTDSVQRALNEYSTVNGLEIVYCDYETTEGLSPGTFQLEVRKACSRAIMAVCLDKDPIHDVLTKDSMGLKPFDYLSYQWQLGSLYFPQQPITATNPDIEYKEAYFNTLDCFDKIKKGAGSTAVSPEQYKYSMGAIGVTLERSALFNLSGVPINNSRVLSVRAAKATAGGTDYAVVFLKYVKLARIFLTNVEVEQ